MRGVGEVVRMKTVLWQNLGQDKILLTIEGLRRLAKAKERRKQQEMDKTAEEVRESEKGGGRGGGEKVRNGHVLVWTRTASFL